ncbi:hypothetical protein BGZ93_003657 [Podila epicladia]|nr:hypothetical protein BGZ92_000243 [Podila epicladia]KAG0100191.1 hypothetical protein BGZ93_003657 [Podila epicladia]
MTSVECSGACLHYGPALVAPEFNIADAILLRPTPIQFSPGDRSFQADTGDASSRVGGKKSWTINCALLERLVEHLPDIKSAKLDSIQLKYIAPTAVRNNSIRHVLMNLNLPILGYCPSATFQDFKP